MESTNTRGSTCKAVSEVAGQGKDTRGPLSGKKTVKGVQVGGLHIPKYAPGADSNTLRRHANLPPAPPPPPTFCLISIGLHCGIATLL